MNGELVLIFALEAVFVTVMTCRWIILVKGSRYLAASASFFEQILNVLALGLVVSSLDSPLRVIVFGLGYATGSILGSWVEEKLAFGYAMLHVVTSKGSNLPRRLRESGIGVTSWSAEGTESDRSMIYIVIRRKLETETLKLIKDADEDAFVVRLEPHVLKGGFLQRTMRNTSRMIVESNASAK